MPLSHLLHPQVRELHVVGGVDDTERMRLEEIVRSGAARSLEDAVTVMQCPNSVLASSGGANVTRDLMPTSPMKAEQQASKLSSAEKSPSTVTQNTTTSSGSGNSAGSSASSGSAVGMWLRKGFLPTKEPMSALQLEKVN